MNLEKIIKQVSESIEGILTGNVTSEINWKDGAVRFHWIKNDKTIYKESMSYEFSFAQLNRRSPNTLATAFLEAWEKSKSFFKPEETVVVSAEPFSLETTSVELNTVEEVSEEKPKKTSKKKKVVEDEGEVVAPPSEADEGS